MSAVSSSRSIWWLSPVGAVALIVPGTLLLASRMSDTTFREIYRTPKSLTGSTVSLLFAGLLVFVLGAMLSLLRPPTRRRIMMYTLTTRQRAVLHRAGNVMFWLTLVGYVAFLASGIRNGVTLGDLVRAVGEQNNFTGELKRGFETVTGITTLTQFGIGYVVAAVFLLFSRPNRRLRQQLRRRLILVLGLALARAFLLTERLAILELVIPAATLIAARFASGGSRRKQWVVRAAPLILIPVVVGFFGLFEYSRSWVYYSNTTTESYPEFTVSRLAGYYVTGYNNGQLLLTYDRYPGRIPYESVQAVWTAPVVKQVGAYGLVSGQRASTLEASGNLPPSSGAVLQQHGNIEFNSPCGLAVPFVDFGMVGGLLFLFAAGCVLGLMYQRFCAGQTTAVLIYPVLATGLFELPRYVYWTQGRTVPSLVALLASGWWLERRGGRPPRFRAGAGRTRSGPPAVAVAGAPLPLTAGTGDLRGSGLGRGMQMTSDTPSSANTRPTGTEKTEPARTVSSLEGGSVPFQRVRPRDVGRAAVAAASAQATSGSAPLVEHETGHERGERLGAGESIDSDVLPVAVWVLVAAFVLATVGFVAAFRDPHYTATALMSVRPDPPLLSDQGTDLPDVEDRFIQSQLLILNGTQLRDDVARRLTVASPFSISASQVGKSSVVQVSATAANAHAAESVADTATTVYIERHLASLQERARTALGAVDEEIGRVRSELDNSAAADVQRNALETEYARLLSLSSQIPIARLQAEQAVTSLETARTAGAQRAVSPVRRAALLGLLGAVVGLGAAIVWRRVSPRIHNTRMIAELDSPPLLPKMPRAARRWQRALDEGGPARGVESAVRLQVAQLTEGHRPLGRPPLCVISATGGAGTSFTAVNLALEAAYRHPTLLVCTADLLGTRTYAGLSVPGNHPEIVEPSNEPWTVARLRKLALPTRVPGLHVLPISTTTEVDPYATAVRPRHQGAHHAAGPAGLATVNGLMEALSGSDWGCVVDCPPLDESGIGLDLAPRAGKVVFVVGLGVSTREGVVNSLRTLSRIGATVSGVIVNRPRWLS